jgi:hypothetical protein
MFAFRARTDLSPSVLDMLDNHQSMTLVSVVRMHEGACRLLLSVSYIIVVSADLGPSIH